MKTAYERSYLPPAPEIGTAYLVTNYTNLYE